MEQRQELERIARLRENEIGPTEENVKQKIVVPLLEALGHRRDELDFEYRTRDGGRLDIFIRRVAPDCKVIIDTKNYGEDLSGYVKQIQTYTFSQNALIAVLANGTEFRIYSLLRGVAFEKSLLFLIRRQDIAQEPIQAVLKAILGKATLQDRTVFEALDDRGRKIRQAVLREDSLQQECDEKLDGIKSEIEGKQEEIENLRDAARSLRESLVRERADMWRQLGLPVGPSEALPSVDEDNQGEDQRTRAQRVRLEELVKRGLVKDGARLHLFYRGRGQIAGEQACIVAAENRVKYDGDGQLYSVSCLAKRLLKKHGVVSHQFGVQGPLHWQTEEGATLHDLNEQVRSQRGHRP